MYTIYFLKKIKIPHFEKYKVKVKFEDLENITVLNILLSLERVGYFISFEMSIK
jgi:hypothetical protein